MPVDLPQQAEFEAWLDRQSIGPTFKANILSTLRKVQREYGSIPRDIEKFNDEYVARCSIGRVRRIHLRLAVRRYCEFRKACYGEPFNDS